MTSRQSDKEGLTRSRVAHEAISGLDPEEECRTPVANSTGKT